MLYIFISICILCVVYILLLKKKIKHLEQLSRKEKITTIEEVNEINELKIRENYCKELIGNVAHELKTPIFSMQGFIFTLLDGAVEDKEILNKYLHLTSKNINRLIQIVQELDEISKYEYGKIKLRQKNFDIVFLISEVFDLLKYKAKENNITLSFEKNYDKQFVYADRNKIEQVLINLIENSIKYGKSENGKTIVSISTQSKKVFVIIQDNGEGIPKSNQSKIFERFYRVEKSRTREKGGAGLGLSIVKHILEAHDQHITVQSKNDKGSTFSFSLNKEQK